MEINFKYLCLYMYLHNSKAETKMRGMKNLVWISLVTMLVIAMAGLGEASPEIVLYVDPEITTKQSGNFDIYVTASDVVDLFLAEFLLRFNSSVLAVVDDPATSDIEGVNSGDVAPYLEKIHVEMLDNTEGWVRVASGREVEVKEGLTGTVQLAKITFSVKAEGFSDLHLYGAPPVNDTQLVGLTYKYGELENVDLEHTKVDGLFTTELFPHDVSVISVTASPDPVGAGGSVSITVDVENQGTNTETFDVTVYYDDTAIDTESVTDLATGASTTLEFTWDTTDVALGDYTIKANATVVEGEVDTSDNVGTCVVTVEEATGLGISLYLVAGLAIVGVVAAIVVVRRVRKPKPE